METYKKLPDDLKRVVLRYIPPSPSAQLIKDFREDFLKEFKTLFGANEEYGIYLIQLFKPNDFLNVECNKKQYIEDIIFYYFLFLRNY